MEMRNHRGTGDHRRIPATQEFAFLRRESFAKRTIPFLRMTINGERERSAAVWSSAVVAAADGRGGRTESRDRSAEGLRHRIAEWMGLTG